jgi:hypothetical protein
MVFAGIRGHTPEVPEGDHRLDFKSKTKSCADNFKKSVAYSFRFKFYRTVVKPIIKLPKESWSNIFWNIPAMSTGETAGGQTSNTLMPAAQNTDLQLRSGFFAIPAPPGPTRTCSLA